MFELLDWDEHGESVSKKDVMLEDGLEDVENLYTNLKNDRINTRYLKMAQSISFLELYSYTIELPVLKHWRPKVEAAVKN